MHDIQHPLKIFLMLLAFIFLVEFSIMYLLAVVEVKPMVDWKEAFIDATLLTALCVPLFWYFVTKPLKNALELENLKSHKILEMAAEGIVSIDTEGKLLSFNRAAQKIFGYSEEEVIGKNVSMLMPPPHRDSHDKYLSRYELTGEAHAIGEDEELQGRRKTASHSRWNCRYPRSSTVVCTFLPPYCAISANRSSRKSASSNWRTMTS